MTPRPTPESAPLPGLDRLDARQRRRVEEVGRRVPVPAHWSMVLERSPADTAYLLLEGRVEVRSRGEHVAELGPGDLIGELGLVVRRLTSATVTTLEPVVTLAFPRADFAALRAEIPAFDELVTSVAQDRQAANAEHRDAATHSDDSVDTVVLDVDGTLVDTVYHHVRAWQSALGTVGLLVPGWRLHRAIGMGGDKLVAHVAGDAAEHAHGDRLRELHDDWMDEVIPQVTGLPGASELLAELRRRGLKVTIATSGPPEQTARLLSIVGADDLAHDRVTNADADQSKPSGDPVAVAVERVGGSRALMIGDAVWDVQAANEQDRPSIGLRTGGFGEAELREAGAGWVYDDPADLLAHLDETPLQPRS